MIVMKPSLPHRRMIGTVKCFRCGYTVEPQQEMVVLQGCKDDLYLHSRCTSEMLIDDKWGFGGRSLEELTR